MDNIKIDLRVIVWDGTGWGPVEGSCEHGDEPLDFLECWEVPEYGMVRVGDQWRALVYTVMNLWVP
jgi:hypothetical protein